VLYQLKRYPEAMLDLNRVIEDPHYPKPFLFKIYRRKALCFLKLGQRQLAIENFQKALEFSKEIQNGETWKKQIEGELQDAIISKQNDVKAQNHPLSFVDFIHPALHLMKEKGPKGRHFITEKVITKGTILLQEAPSISFLRPQYLQNYCSHCFKKSDTLIPCLTCVKACFCSEECAKAGADWHFGECSHYFFDEFDPTIRLGWRLSQLICQPSALKEEPKLLLEELESHYH